MALVPAPGPRRSRGVCLEKLVDERRFFAANCECARSFADFERIEYLFQGTFPGLGIRNVCGTRNKHELRN
jgi:hypothetical protein